MKIKNTVTAYFPLRNFQIFATTFGSIRCQFLIAFSDIENRVPSGTNGVVLYRKDTFKTKYRHFEFFQIPMSLCNATATFQALMNSIFGDFIEDFFVIYLDDILVFSNTRGDNLKHLRLVLSRLQENESYIGSNKYELMRSETEFLGLIVGRNEIRIGDDRKKLIKDWRTPSTITELRIVLGLVQFFRRFIRDFSRIAAPFTNLTRKNGCISKWDSLSMQFCPRDLETIFDSGSDKASSRLEWAFQMSYRS